MIEITNELTFMITTAFVVGGIIGYIIHRLQSRRPREIRKILKKPKLMIEELNKHGPIYDDGERVEFVSKVDPKSLKEEIIIHRGPVKKNISTASTTPHKEPPKKKIPLVRIGRGRKKGDVKSTKFKTRKPKSLK